MPFSACPPLLCVGDIHVKQDTLETIDTLASLIISELERVPGSACVFLGDLLHDHERIKTPYLNKVMQLVRNVAEYASGGVIVLVGNHDYISNREFMSDAHWMQVFDSDPNVTVVDRAMVLFEGEVVAMPYVPPGRMIEALDTVGPNRWKYAKLVLAHQEMKGFVYGEGPCSITSEHGDSWSNEYPLLVSGHIHTPQRKGKVIYPGSSLQTNSGELQKRSLLWVRGGSVSDTEEVEVVNVPQRINTTLRCDDLIRDLQYLDSKYPKPHLYKLTITGTDGEIAALRARKMVHAIPENIRLKLVVNSINDDESTSIPVDDEPLNCGMSANDEFMMGLQKECNVLEMGLYYNQLVRALSTGISS